MARPARDERKGGVFFGRTEDGLLLVAARRRRSSSRARRAVRRLGRHLRADVVRRPSPRRTPRPRRRCDRGTRPITRFAEVAASGILSALDSDAARSLAGARLAPLRDARRRARHGAHRDRAGVARAGLLGSTRRHARSGCTGTPCARGSGSPRPCSAPISRRSRPAPTSGRRCRSRRLRRARETAPPLSGGDRPSAGRRHRSRALPSARTLR